MGSRSDAPADNPPGEGVDHERDVDKAGPGREIGEVRHPQRIRPISPELAVDAVERARRRLVADCRADRLAPNDALQPHRLHQPRHRAAGDVEPLALQLPPHLARAVDAEVLLEHTFDFDLQSRIALRPRR